MAGNASSAHVLEQRMSQVYTILYNAFLKELPKDVEDHIVKGGNHAPAGLKHSSHKVLVNAEVVNKAQDVQDDRYQFVEE